jgi:uncharacterized protein YegJ (DUF2314 family)
MLKLKNAERLHRAAPSTFELLPREERAALRPGDLAKVCLEARGHRRGSERLWVRVQRVSGEAPIFRGVLDNEPFTLDGVRLGDAVRFGPEHVYDIDRRRGLFDRIMRWLLN